jgi:hypothetical protein
VQQGDQLRQRMDIKIILHIHNQHKNPQTKPFSKLPEEASLQAQTPGPQCEQ